MCHKEVCFEFWDNLCGFEFSDQYSLDVSHHCFGQWDETTSYACGGIVAAGSYSAKTLKVNNLFPSIARFLNRSWLVVTKNGR